MTNLINALLNDDKGFIVSAELVLIATICVLGVMVGLAELSFNVNQELEDVGSAFTCLQQSYYFQQSHGTKGCVDDSYFEDSFENGDGQFDITCDR